MNISRNWLKEFVDIEATDREYDEIMTIAGQKVETTTRMDAEIKNVVVGKVLSMARHENSDHMWVCMVDVGAEQPVQIVTGAQNVHEGDLVPVAQHNSWLPGGVHITKGKLRGVESCGMLCSFKELGLTQNDVPDAYEDGIWILNNEDCTVGEDINHVMGTDDSIVEFEITNNRPDCYSLLGLARETAAAFNIPMRHHEPVVKGGAEGVLPELLDVEVPAEDLCLRYTARMVRNVKIAPSPKWMRQRLRSAGIRPINNIVDITNYVMVEYGQPMHAFDYRYVKGGKIIVRRAGEDKTLTTLDGNVRQLQPDMLVIADETKPVGLAGIMGGENSEIVDDTADVVFESANFLGASIRKTALALGMRTDASAKFEKDIDPMLTVPAVNRACELVEMLGAGEVVDGMIYILNYIPEPVTLPLEPAKINALLGTDISAEEMLGYFKKIDLGYDEKTNEVIAPTFRQDLFRTADLAEEVARFYGYANIPTTLPTGEATTGKLPFDLRVRAVAQDIAEFCGFSQGMMYSFESPKAFEKLMLPADSPLRNAIKIMNPLGEDFSIMRTQSVNGMLTSLGFNYSHRNKNVRLYELGNIYIPKALPLTELPNERVQFTLGMYGDGDFFTMKGVIEEFLDKLGITGRKSYRPDSGKSFLHPGRQADVYYGDKLLGFLGEVHPLVASAYGIGEKAYIAVLDMPAVTELATFDRKYAGIAKFPAVSRDISMVVPKHILAGEIEDVIIQRGGKILESCQLFDIYEGAQIRHGFKSMAYSITFRAKDRTLEEGDITAAMKKIWNGLEALGIEIRA